MLEYSEGFKSTMVQRMMETRGKTATALASERRGPVAPMNSTPGSGLSQACPPRTYTSAPGLTFAKPFARPMPHRKSMRVTGR